MMRNYKFEFCIKRGDLEGVKEFLKENTTHEVRIRHLEKCASLQFYDIFEYFLDHYPDLLKKDMEKIRYIFRLLLSERCELSLLDKMLEINPIDIESVKVFKSACCGGLNRLLWLIGRIGLNQDHILKGCRFCFNWCEIDTLKYLIEHWNNPNIKGILKTSIVLPPKDYRQIISTIEIIIINVELSIDVIELLFKRALYGYAEEVVYYLAEKYKDEFKLLCNDLFEYSYKYSTKVGCFIIISIAHDSIDIKLIQKLFNEFSNLYNRRDALELLEYYKDINYDNLLYDLTYAGEVFLLNELIEIVDYRFKEKFNYELMANTDNIEILKVLFRGLEYDERALDYIEQEDIKIELKEYYNNIRKKSAKKG